MARSPQTEALSRRVTSFAGRMLLLLGPILVGASLAISGHPLVDQLRNLVFDDYQWLAPRQWRADLPVRIVDIDDESLARIGQWPWPRDRMAELADKLSALHAAAVGFDVTFFEPDRASPKAVVERLPASPERNALLERLVATDDAFAHALGPSRSVLALVLAEGSGAETFAAKAGFAEAGDSARLFVPAYSRVIAPLRELADAAQGLGAINFTPDRDLVLRKIPLVFGLGTDRSSATLVPSLDAELLRVAQGASTILVKSSNASGETGFGAKTGVVAVKIGALVIPTDSDGSVRVRYAGFQPGRRIPAWKLLQGGISEDEIAGRIIIVGASAAALGDLRSTPIQGGVPGDEIHAELLEHVLSNQHLARPDYAPGLEAVAVAAGGLLVGFFARRTAPLTAAIVSLALVAGIFAGSFFAYSRFDLLLDPLVPGASWLLAYGITTIALYRRTEIERRFVRTAFARYVAPAVVERLASDPGQLRLGGELRPVTILFADARDFTRRSEGRSAESVVEFLNRLHTPLTAAVLAENGTIDKYIGDGLMAFWNAPLDVADHPDRACRAALAMLAALDRVDEAERRAAEAAGLPHIPVRIGIGLNTGDVFVGNMGSEMVFDYSIVGDPVNVAARLESITKEFGVPVIASEATRRAATGFRFLDLGESPLKGKSGPVRVFALHGPVTAEEDFQGFHALHEAVLAALRVGGAGAETAISKAAAHPLAERYQRYYQRLADSLHGEDSHAE